MKSLLVLAIAIVFTACSTEKIKEKINKTGDVAGQAVGEFTSGVASGVEKAIEPKIVLNEKLKSNGISFGKIIISGDSSNLENILTAYVIFGADFKGYLTAKAFDNKNREMGRVKVEVTGMKDDARYVEFRFDPRADIDNDSELIIE